MLETAMATSTYDESLRRVLAHEGGYTNHPDDPGGPTNFGITIIDYRKYVKADASAADIRTMALSDAKTIYRAKYWDALRCDALAAGVDYAVFDYGVNSGISRSAKVLQRIVGVADDGKIGPVTLAAVAGQNPSALVTNICHERLVFLKRLRTWPVFGKGWGRRVAEVKTAALAMAKNATRQSEDR
jgi:lysozyme family protein